MAELKQFYYNPTTWIDNRTSINAERMNNIERGLSRLVSIIEAQNEYITELENRIENLSATNITWRNNTENNFTEQMNTVIGQFTLARDTVINDAVTAAEATTNETLVTWTHNTGLELNDRLTYLERDTDDLKISRNNIESWRADQMTKNDSVDTLIQNLQAFERDSTTALTDMQTRITNAETTANDAKTESSAATSRIALNQNEWSTFKTNMESTLTNNNTTIALLGGQIASLDIDNKINTVRTGLENSIAAINIPSTSSIAAELKTLGFMKETDLTADKISTLGFAKGVEVEERVIQAETEINKATNQKLGTAFGLTVNDDDDVDMTALQTQLQNFAGSTLLTANIISDATEGNQTLTQWLNNKQNIENNNFTNISTMLTQLAEDISDIKTKLNEHASSTTAHTSTSGGLFDNVEFAGDVGLQIGGGFTPNIGFNNNNNSNNP